MQRIAGVLPRRIRQLGPALRTVCCHPTLSWRLAIANEHYGCKVPWRKEAMPLPAPESSGQGPLLGVRADIALEGRNARSPFTVMSRETKLLRTV